MICWRCRKAIEPADSMDVVGGFMYCTPCRDEVKRYEQAWRDWKPGQPLPGFTIGQAVTPEVVATIVEAINTVTARVPAPMEPDPREPFLRGRRR
jgi:hypothetical protein